MKSRFLFLLLALKWSFTFPQSRQQVDSLLNRLTTETADSNRLKLYSKLGNYYIDNNGEKAIGYFTQAATLAQRLNKPFTVAKARHLIAYCYSQKGNFSKAIDYYFQAARLFENLNDSAQVAHEYMAIANVYFQNNNVEKTDEYHNKAQQLIENLKDTTQLIDLFSAKAQVYDKRKLYSTSLAYAQKAYRLALAIHDDFRATGQLSDIGLTYKHLKKTAAALQNFDKALIGLTKLGADPYTFASIYNNIGATYAQAGQYAQAKVAFDKSITIAQQAGLPAISMENYRNLADMYGDQKKSDLQVVYLKKYDALKDSLFTTDSKNRLIQLEADYTIDQKNLEIAKQEAEVEKQKNQRNIFIFITITAALLLAALALFYNRIRKANQSLAEKNTQILEQKEALQTALVDLKNVQEELIRQEKLASVGQLTKGIVDRILNPLNYIDNFSQLSTGVLNDLLADLDIQKDILPSDKLDNLFDDITLLQSNLIKIQAHSHSTTRIVKDMQKLLREKSRDFVETDLNRFLETKTQTFLQEIKPSDFTVSLNLHLAQPPIRMNVLPYEFGHAIQILVSNAYYTLHEKQKSDSAYQPKIDIVLESSPEGGVIIRFRDNGKGIPPNEIAKLFSPFFTTKPTSEGTGLGLYMLKEIVELHKGTIAIHSTEGAGTEIVLTFPAAHSQLQAAA